MTKVELEKDRDEWKEQAESLQEELDALNEAYYDLECRLADQNDPLLRNNISNLSNFIYRMKIDGVWTEQIEEFMNNYLRFYND